jgi:hypothetical protein
MLARNAFICVHLCLQWIKLRDGSKTSELCNRLTLLDHNKINLVLIFYAL